MEIDLLNYKYYISKTGLAALAAGFIYYSSYSNYLQSLAIRVIIHGSVLRLIRFKQGGKGFFSVTKRLSGFSPSKFYLGMGVKY